MGEGNTRDTMCLDFSKIFDPMSHETISGEISPNWLGKKVLTCDVKTGKKTRNKG